MPLSPKQVQSYAHQYAGMLMLDADARKAMAECGHHDRPDFHSKLARVLNDRLQPAQPLDGDDASAICRYTSQNVQEFRMKLKEAAPGCETALMPYMDGWHGQ